jgi:hypothetical protein
MSNSTSTQSSNPIAAFFSHGFLSVALGIFGLISSPLVLHLLPSSIAAVIIGLAAGWKAYQDEKAKQTTTATVVQAATSAAASAQSASDTAARLETNAAIARAQAKGATASPLQGGALK